MDHSPGIPVATYGTSWEAHCHQYFLKSHGIDAEVAENLTSGLGAGMPGLGFSEVVTSLVVAKADVERAQEVLKTAPSLSVSCGRVLAFDFCSAIIVYSLGLYLLSAGHALLGLLVPTVYTLWLILDIWRGREIRKRFADLEELPSLTEARVIGRRGSVSLWHKRRLKTAPSGGEDGKA